VLAIVILIVAFVFLIKSAGWLVDAASKIGTLFGISRLVIGLTVVAFGTSAPELAVSILAVTGNHSGLVVGNIIGSNLINIALGIGISAVFLTLTICRSTLKELSILMGSTVLLLLLFTKGTFQVPFEIGRWEGVVLLIGFLLFMFHIYLGIKKGKETSDLPECERKNTKSLILIVGQLLLGIIGLLVSGHLVVNQCVHIGRLLNIEESIIGITIIAIGTSLPDVITSVVAAYKGNSDMAIGNIIGSSIFNALLILGVSAVLSSKVIRADGLEIDFLVMALISAILYLSALWYRQIGKMVGLLLILMYVAYMSWVVLAIL